MSSPNWHNINESNFPWERDALDFIRERFPDREPYRAWQLFEFIADDGSINEVDLLALTPVGFFLVEIKSRPGILRGDAGTWTWEHEGRLFTDDNSVIAANRKAKKLKGLLEKQKALRNFKGRLPFLEVLVFCSAPHLQLNLEGTARYRVCLRDREATDDRHQRPGIMAALQRRECPGLEPSSRKGDRSNLCPAPFSAVDRPLAKAIAQALEQAGIRPSRRARKIGDFVLNRQIMEGKNFQDWLATHVKLDEVKRRVRLYLVPGGATADQRETIERAALREFQILDSLQHPGILRTYGCPEHELGPTVIFEHYPKSIRLDHYLAQCGPRLTPELRLDLLRQIAEVVRFAHDKKTVHRALSPQSILVVDPDNPRAVEKGSGPICRNGPEGAAHKLDLTPFPRPQIKVLNWQVGYREAGSATGASRGHVSGTVHVDQLVEDASTAYLAPETLLSTETTGEHLDIFSLGAIAYHLYTGQPPAANALELSEKLRQGKGLQISSVVNGVSENLQFLIQYSTHPDVTYRLDSARDFLECLDEVQRELLGPDHDLVQDPTQAQIDDQLPGGLVVKKRLGSGACSVALLVERDGQELVLKVASDPAHNDRLRNEGQVLQKLRHQHIVEHLQTLEMGGRVCLLMHRAGAETLGDRLRKEGRLHVDLLQRFGEDLLDVVRFLEEQGIPHRDIKPENMAVGKVGRGDKLHLVLFDFSLSRTPRENIRAGTTGYLEPFLASRKPARWDLHAERYAAAVTLYELATGMLPKWGNGQSDPAVLDCEITIDAELFDANLRDQFNAFFRKALRRNPAERFDNAEEMLRAWRHCFEGIAQSVSTGHEDWAEVEKRLLAASLETPIAELGLGTRATNALDRVNVLSVRQLLAVPPRRLARLRGVGNKTRREITDAVKILRSRLDTPEHVTPPTVLAGPETATGEAEAVVGSVDLLVQRVLGHLSVVSGQWSVEKEHGPGTKNKGQRTRDRFLLAYLGLDPEVSESWPSQADVADHLGVTRGRVGQLATAAQERWKRDPSITNLRTDVVGILTSNGGAMAVEELAAAILLARGSVEDEPRRTRLALAVTRLAVDVERVMAEPRLVVRRTSPRPLPTRQLSVVSGQLPPVAADSGPPAALSTVVWGAGRVLVATNQDLADYAARLGRAADELAAEDPLVPPTRVLERLRAVRAPSGVDPLPDARLVRLAAASSQTAAVSSKQELYPYGMDASRALKLSQQALLGARRLTVEEIRSRVVGRYPEAARLPDRPALDDLLRAAGIEPDWDETAGAYRTRIPEPLVSSSPSAPLTRRPTQAGPPPGEVTPEEAQARQFEERLQRALADGSFVAMTVEPRGYARAREELGRRFPLQQVDLEAVFLQALRDVADKAKVKWERVLQADAVPGSDDWNRLMLLVRRAVPLVEQTILVTGHSSLVIGHSSLVTGDQGQVTEDQGQMTSDQGPRTILLIYPGLLARYEQMDLLQRLREKVGRAGGIPGLWMLIASDESTELPVLDGHAVPVIGRAEWARIPEYWLENRHRGGSE